MTGTPPDAGRIDALESRLNAYQECLSRLTVHSDTLELQLNALQKALSCLFAHMASTPSCSGQAAREFLETQIEEQTFDLCWEVEQTSPQRAAAIRTRLHIPQPKGA